MNTLIKIRYPVQPAHVFATLSLLIAFCLLQLTYVPLAEFAYVHMFAAILYASCFTALRLWVHKNTHQKPVPIAFYVSAIAFSTVVTYFTGGGGINGTLNGLIFGVATAALVLPCTIKSTHILAALTTLMAIFLLQLTNMPFAEFSYMHIGAAIIFMFLFIAVRLWPAKKPRQKLSPVELLLLIITIITVAYLISETGVETVFNALILMVVFVATRLKTTVNSNATTPDLQGE